MEDNRMNLITYVKYGAAQVFDLDTDQLIASKPIDGLTRDEAIILAEQMAAELLAEQDCAEDPYLASQRTNWRP